MEWATYRLLAVVWCLAFIVLLNWACLLVAAHGHAGGDACGGHGAVRHGV